MVKRTCIKMEMWIPLFTIKYICLSPLFPSQALSLFSLSVPSSLSSLSVFLLPHSLFFPSLTSFLSFSLFDQWYFLILHFSENEYFIFKLVARQEFIAIISQEKWNFHIILFKVLVLNILFWWLLNSTTRKRGPRENQCHFWGCFFLSNKFKLHNKIFYKTVLHIIIF